MERTPYASDTLVQALDRLRHSLQLLAVGLLKQFCLLHDLVWGHITDAYRLYAAIDVVALDDGVLAGSRGDCDFDARVLFREGLQLRLEESAATHVRMLKLRCRRI